MVTIEDAAELQLAMENIVRCETRPPNIEGQGAVRQRQLLINSLRMRPDRIIIGEVRGEEAFDMLQAMNTGHEGSMTTIHANTPRDALTRLESMVAMSSLNLPEKTVRQQIASAIAIVVQVSQNERRHPQGDQHLGDCRAWRRTSSACRRYSGSTAKGSDRTARWWASFQPTQIRPKFLERLRIAGIFLPP